MDTEKVVEAYLAIRNERDRIRHEYEAQDARLLEDLKKVEAVLLSLCNSINADSVKTSLGTVMRRLNERYYCQDWENFYQFVMENNAVQLLEKRIHQGNFRQFISEHEGDGLPPGVNVMREYGISVRKSSSAN